MENSKSIDEKKSVPTEETPSRSKDLSKTLPEEAFNNFLQGKRHIVVQDYKFAVQSLSTACELYTQHFGELALECGEVHFLYGKALFRLSQQQAGVFGEALNEEVTETEDDESGKASVTQRRSLAYGLNLTSVREQVESAEEDSKENESDKNDTDTDNGEENPEDAEEAEEKEPSESTDSPQAAVSDDASKEPTEKEASETASKVADTSAVLDESKAEEEQPEQEEEELDDLELAWNTLETAKSIFLRQGENDAEAQLKVAEILQLLAEISMESDNNMAAISDLKDCLVIKRRHLKPDDRLLAETFYQMGLAQLLEKMYSDALDNFSTTMSILQLRIDNRKATPVLDTVGNFEKADREKEIGDLESVLADIREKVEDTKELIKDAEKVFREEISKRYPQVEETGFPAASEKTETNNKPVTNITHLLKRKKPDQDEEKERELKRPKLTSAVPNGDSK